MNVTDIADRLLDGVETARRRAGAWREPTLRLGVTGLSGAGKTVFITALVASLLDRGRMRMLSAEAEGRITAAMLRPQPDPAIARFAFEAHHAALTGPQRHWPDSTRSVSQLRLAIRFRPTGFIGALTHPGVLNLDIVDYPGEWLVDLALMEQDYETWAREALAAAQSPARVPHAGEWRAALADAEPAAAHAEPAAEALATAYAGYLGRCRAAGLSALAPGRFLMPGEMAGSPALTFAPLPRPETISRDSLYAEMRNRFEAYKRHVVRPFFRDHFAALDRQVVLVDALGALASGPQALADLTQGMADTLGAFRHGGNRWLDRLIGQRRIDRLLFVASKADHLHHLQHARLTTLVEAMLAEASGRARFQGAETRAMAIAAVRATVEQEITRNGKQIAMVRGPRLDTGREAAVFPGQLPDDPRTLVSSAMHGTAERWPDGDFARVPFAPPAWGDRAGDGPPHIRLDQALEFLVGDKLE